MCKLLRHTYLFILAALVAGCSSDNGEATTAHDGNATDNSIEPVSVGLRITAAGSGSTKAWSDGNANDNEMMNLWTVVVADASGNVKAIHACKPTGDVKPEVDSYVSLTPGTYTFYSFANMAPSVVMQLLGINGTGATGSTATRGDNKKPEGENDNDPTTGGNNDNPEGGDNNPSRNPQKKNTDDIDSKASDTAFEISFEAGATVTADVANVVARVDGNGFDPTATDNGFGSKGIPMSNVQTKVITSSTNFDLIVVRMMAKVELQIKNETGADITVNSATLSNVSQNDNGNLKLLPSLTQHDTMEPSHKDIQPNLGAAARQGDYTVTVGKTIANGDTENVSFYVNESSTPTNAEGLFYLTLEMDNSGSTEYRYALISNQAGEWNYIARNDYRIIPVTLDDYHFQLVPYDFPPIGVYPVSVKELNATENLYEFTFHDYGHFHLLPQVTKGGSTQVKYNLGSGDYWTLSTDWANSWFTAATKGGAWLDAAGITANGFYRSGAGSTTADGDDEGQAPVWYLNDGTAGPQWDPAAPANYQPFIFGYIADPGSTMSKDKKIYHEMKIRLYVGGSYRRDMIFRCYMTLSKDQMLYAPAYKPAPRRSHDYGH